jgi:hypothetical protein
MISSEKIQENIANNQAAFKAIIDKANQDSSFKSSLLTDAEKTLKEFNPKFKLPDGYQILVEDQPELNTVAIDLVKQDNVELAEAELEMVAGGVAGGSMGCICLFTW